MSKIHDEDRLSDITNDCTTNETENSCNRSSNSTFSETSSSSTSTLTFHHQQRSRFRSSRNFHRWTSHAPAVTLSITLIIFTSIMGFFAFHAVFSSTPQKSTRVRTGTHTSKITSGTQGLPPEKDLLRLSQLPETHQATFIQSVEDENGGGKRRIRQNLGADYNEDFMDTDDDMMKMEYPKTSTWKANREVLLQGTHCLIPDLAMRPFDRISDPTNEGECITSKDLIYGIGDSRDCCFQVIAHSKKSVSPNQWQSLVCTPIDPQDQGYSKRLLEKYEFVRISCKVMKKGYVESRYEFRQSISLESERVREKIQYWIDHSSQPPPPSILIIGLEGISRRRFHQSFTQSRNLLLNGGFIDLKGYHVVGPKTLDNLIPLLMGKWKRDLVKVCNHRWTSYWDKCPFIWKKFDESNYVTLYAEDIPDSFNYGNQLGFEFKPTDYYFRPFLLEKTRQDNNPFCFGNTTTAASMLVHVQNFMEKFKGFSTPFFAFSWLNLERLSHHKIDRILVEFLLKIKSKDLLQNTLVIVLSDHGLQAGGMRQGLHGYLDHRLPIAFFKLPSSLSAYQSVLNENSQELTSPFDIHDTLMNVLSLTTSLTNDSVSTTGLVKTMKNRTCAAARIASHWCTCNMKILEHPTSSSPFMRFIGQEGLIAIIISKLNEMAGLQKESLALPSTQAGICPEIFFEKVTYVGIADDESSLSEIDWILIGIQVFPKHAQFELVLKKEWNKWEVILPAIRTDTNKGYIYCLNIFKRNKSITK